MGRASICPGLSSDDPFPELPSRPLYASLRSDTIETLREAAVRHEGGAVAAAGAGGGASPDTKGEGLAPRRTLSVEDIFGAKRGGSEGSDRSGKGGGGTWKAKTSRAWDQRFASAALGDGAADQEGGSRGPPAAAGGSADIAGAAAGGLGHGGVRVGRGQQGLAEPTALGDSDCLGSGAGGGGGGGGGGGETCGLQAFSGRASLLSRSWDRVLCGARARQQLTDSSVCLALACSCLGLALSSCLLLPCLARLLLPV